MGTLPRKLTRALVLTVSGASSGTITTPTHAAIDAALATTTGAATYASASQTATFNVTLQVLAICAIAVVPVGASQTEGVSQSSATADNSINITCSHTTLYDVGLNAAAGAKASAAAQYRSVSGVNTGTVWFRLPKNARAINRETLPDSMELTATVYF
jgi:spore coat protein U-like protein